MHRHVSTPFDSFLFQIVLVLALALCPVLWSTPSCPASIPFPTEHAVDCTGVAGSAAEWTISATEHCKTFPAIADHFTPSDLNAIRPTSLIRVSLSSLSICDIDPMRNGLGSPYRC